MRIQTILSILCAGAFGAGCVVSEEEPDFETTDQQIGTVNNLAKWPNEIKYVIDETGVYPGKFSSANCGDANWGEPLFPGDDDVIRQAIDFYNRFGPIHFTEVSASAPMPSTPFLIFTARADHEDDASGHAGSGGMPSNGISCVYLGTGSLLSVNTVDHEVGHEIGWLHEQRRDDSRDFIQFSPACVGSDTNPWDVVVGSPLMSPYDFDSIMEYSSESQCCNQSFCCPDGTKSSCLSLPMVRVEKADCDPLLEDCSCDPGTAMDSTDPRCLVEQDSDTPGFSVHDINALYRMYEVALGVNHNNDHLGDAVAVGDFDGDGFQDVAVGAPDDESNKGGVFVWRGVSSEVEGELQRLVAWKYLKGGNNYTRFGTSLAAGDFDNDGITDLAVGAPGELSGNTDLGGAVYVYRVDRAATKNEDDIRRDMGLILWQSFTDLQLDLSGAQPYDRFGAALAAGDFDNDGVDELAVGIPHHRIGSSNTTRAGWVEIYGKSGDDNLVAEQTLKPTDSSALTGYPTPAANDKFGFALHALDLDPDNGSKDDLVIGSPQSGTKTGVAYLYRGTTTGLSAKQVLVPTGTSIAGGEFGSAITSGQYNLVSLNSEIIPVLAIGAPEASAAKGKVLLFQRTSTTYAVSQQQSLVGPLEGDRIGEILLGGALTDCVGLCFDDLFVGAPDRAGIGAVLRYRHTGSTLLDTTPSVINRGSPTTGEQFGSGLGLGNFWGPTANGHNVELVVGASGFSAASGAIFVRENDSGTITFHRRDQETASPE